MGGAPRVGTRLARVIMLVLPVLPQGARRALYPLLGWEVHRTAKIGLSFVSVDFLRMGAGSHIGHLNRVRGLSEFHIGERSYLRNLNDVVGEPAEWCPDRTLHIGVGSGVMSRHLLDVAGRITIGDGCVVGGRGTQVWTHTLEWRDGVRHLAPREVVLGDGVYVGAAAILVGCTVADSCTIGAGAVVAGEHLDAHQLITGNPARSRPDIRAPGARARLTPESPHPAVDGTAG